MIQLPGQYANPDYVMPGDRVRELKINSWAKWVATGPYGTVVGLDARDSRLVIERWDYMRYEAWEQGTTVFELHTLSAVAPRRLPLAPREPNVPLKPFERVLVAIPVVVAVLALLVLVFLAGYRDGRGGAATLSIFILLALAVGTVMLGRRARGPATVAQGSVTAPSKAVHAPPASPATSVPLEPMESRPVRLEHSLTDDFIDELDKELEPYRKHRKL